MEIDLIHMDCTSSNLGHKFLPFLCRLEINNNDSILVIDKIPDSSKIEMYLDFEMNDF